MFYPSYMRLELSDEFSFSLTLALNIQFTFASFHFATILPILTELPWLSSFCPGQYVVRGMGM